MFKGESMDRKSLIEFYKETDYKTKSLSIRGILLDYAEWNVPHFY